MDALRTVYGEKGAATWEDMVTCVREYRQLDNVGGKDALNRIYSLHPTTGLPDPKTEELRTDQILKGHIYSLKTYAEARDFTPARSMYQFIGGRGTAYPNKAKRKGLRADYTGSARIRGSIYQMHMDVAPGGQFINVRFEPPTR
jgi:hypothetical protein